MITSRTKLSDLSQLQLIELQNLLNIKTTGTLDELTKNSFYNWKNRNFLGDLDYIGPHSYNLLLEYKQNNINKNYNLGIIKNYEGFRANAYPDPLKGWEIPTIGYGTTIYSNGNKVKRGDSISMEKASEELINYVNKKIVPVLSTTIPYWGDMNINQQSALISFAYNLGEHFYGKSNVKTISQVLKDKKWKDVPKAMLLYRNPGTNVEQGLKSRRIAEGLLFSS